jgi:hypothetical protein
MKIRPVPTMVSRLAPIIIEAIAAAIEMSQKKIRPLMYPPVKIARVRYPIIAYRGSFVKWVRNVLD